MNCDARPAHEPLAYLNGDWIPFSAARLPVWDQGLVQAVTVTERLRTFNGRLFRIEEHLARLQMGLQACGIEPVESAAQLRSILERVAAENVARLPVGHDLTVVLLVTPGESPPLARGLVPVREAPTVCVHPAPLAAVQWAAAFDSGLSLVTPAIRQPSREVIPPHIKHRSRLHWHLAQREVQRVDPAATALLLDEKGYVTETAAANLFVVKEGRLLTPREETVLPGVSRSWILQLAEESGVPAAEADLTVADLLEADEIFLTSTGFCLLPVAKVNGVRVSAGVPGPVFERLLAVWSGAVGVDIREQIEEMAAPGGVG